MRIKIIFENKRDLPIQSFYVSNYKVKLNKMPVTDISFNNADEVFFIDNAEIFKDKKNVIKFRYVSLDEKEEKEKAIVSNIFRGIGFALMAIFLPFAVMRFKNVNTPFSKLKFNYSETKDFVLAFNPYGCSYRFEDSFPIGEPFADIIVRSTNISETIQDINKENSL